MTMEVGTREYPVRYFPVNLNLFQHFGRTLLFFHLKS